MKKRQFVQNAAVMTITTLLLRTIGMGFRVFISHRIGAEGMGLYQLIVSVYVLASSFASSGLTTAVTRLCTDALACCQPQRAHTVLRISVKTGILLGAVSAALIGIGSEWIAACWLHDSRAVYSLYTLSFGLPFMGISCCIKGYFFAKRKVNASSLSQILEQVTRIGVTAWLLMYERFQEVAMSCMAVMIGDTVAEAVSCAYIVIVYAVSAKHTDVDRDESFRKQTQKELASIAAPITAGRYINTGLRTIENSAVPYALSLFCHSYEAALADFGKLRGMALPLVFFPSGFLNAFAALLIPEVSESAALGYHKQLKRTVKQSILITLLFAWWIGAVLFVIAKPLSVLVYGDAAVGDMISWLSLLTPVMYLESVTVGLLKGLNQQTRSLIYGIVDSLTRILMIYTLLPSYGMNGLILLMVISNFLTSGLHLHRLLKTSACRFDCKRWLWIPLSAASAAIAVGRGFFACPSAEGWSTITAVLVGICAVSAVYLPLIFLFRAIRLDDLAIIRKKSTPTR